jgi:glycerate dehydrogenase
MAGGAPKIIVVDGHTLGADGNSWSVLDPLGHVTVFERSTPEEVVVRARDAEVLITNKAVVSAAAIDAATALRLIAVTATGYDCVDIAAARRRGVAVVNVPEYGTRSVAQFTFALVLELCHRVGLHADAVREGAWSTSPDFCFWRTPQVELADKVMGIVGFGRIGRSVAAIAQAFGMDVLVSGRSAKRESSSVTWVELDELFARADVISLHCPLTADTAGLVSRERLRRVKPSAFLINTSRGGLVVEEDLAHALNEGRLAGAAVDVVAREPARPENPLLSARNCLVTPHIAWATREARRRLLEATFHNIRNFLAGQPTHVIR